MKKLIVLAIVCLLTACGEQKEGNVQDTIAGNIYTYENDGFGGEFTIQIDKDGTYEYYEGSLSSYIGVGEWTLDDDILVLTDDEATGKAFANRFKIVENNLVFLSDNSSNFLYVKVADGEEFKADEA